MTDILVIQNSPLEGIGALGHLLENDGAKLHTIDARNNSFPSKDYDGLIVLGGPQSANDDHEYLKTEQEIMRHYMERKAPVLGICLGSQLLARACGAKVYRGAKPEIGFYGDLVPNTNDPLMSDLDSPFDVFHWHAETFDLPEGAVRLASSESYENQAFRIGSAIGLQFHLEVGDMLESWIDAAREQLQRDLGIDPKDVHKIAESLMPNVSANMSKVYQNLKSDLFA